MKITHEMIRQAWLAAHSVETQDRCNNEMLRRAIAALAPLILEEAAKVAEKLESPFGEGDPSHEDYSFGCTDAASAIRALKEPHHDR